MSSFMGNPNLLRTPLVGASLPMEKLVEELVLKENPFLGFLVGSTRVWAG